MSRSLHIDSDLLHALVAELSAAADQAGLDLTELKSVLAQQGEPWGDDEPGQQIGEAYVPQADRSLEGYENLVDNLRRLSTEIAGATDSFEQQDQDLGNLIGEGGDNVAPYPTQTGYPTSVTPVPYAQSPQQQPESAYPGDTTSGTAGQPTTTPASSPQSRDPESTPTRMPTGYDPSSMPAADEQQPGSSDSAAPQGNQAPSGGAPPSSPGAAAPRSAVGADPGAGAGRSRAASPAKEPSPRVGGNSATPGKNTQTPWSRGPNWSPPTGATRRPNSPGSPWSRSGLGNSRLGRVFGPEPGGPGAVPPNQLRKNRKDKARKEKQRAAAAPVIPTDPRALELTRAMAERHGLRLAGFETSGIGMQAVGEIAAALDDLLGKYPFATLSGLEVTELGSGRVSEVRDAEPGRGAWLLLDRTLVANPARLAVAAERAVRSGRSIPETAERPMYSALVTDFGRILGALAGPRPHRTAQRALITEYHRISGPWSGRDTLAHVVRGYRRWRDALGSMTGGRFDPEAALTAAFTEVEMRGAAACGPAKVLHLLVVEGARGRSSPR